MMQHPLIIGSYGKPFSPKQKTLKGQLISHYLGTPAGRQALANAMVQPLRTTLDYQGIARRAINIQPLPSGALPIYDRDPGVYDIVVESQLLPKFKHNKLVIRSSGKVSRSNRVMVPTFELVDNPTIHISEVRARRFKLIDRGLPDEA